MELSLKCQACVKTKVNLWKRKPAWARIPGFADCVKWFNKYAGQPGNGLERMEGPPLKGKKYALLVQHPFWASQAEAFWALFQPALSSENGWEEFPSELALSSLVRCRLLTVLERNAGSAWIEVKALENIGLREVCRRFNEDDRGSPFGEIPTDPHFPLTRIHWEDLSYLSANLEGDIGAWVVCQTTGQDHRVLLYGEWDGCQDFVYAGNRPLTVGEASLLEKTS